jgi:hypothetical protein
MGMLHMEVPTVPEPINDHAHEEREREPDETKQGNPGRPQSDFEGPDDPVHDDRVEGGTVDDPAPRQPL